MRLEIELPATDQWLLWPGVLGRRLCGPADKLASAPDLDRTDLRGDVFLAGPILPTLRVSK